MTIRAIETQYAGYRFRSRLEARWAVFFDHMKVPWRYEHEGYETSAGWYLPDFELDILSHPGGWRIFAEVKGAPLRQDEAERIAALVSDDLDAKFAVIPLGDIPDPREVSDFYCFHAWLAGGFGYLNRDGLDFIAPFDGPVEAKRMDAQFRGSLASCPPFPGHPATSLQKAFTAARSARFEHGETPR